MAHEGWGESWAQIEAPVQPARAQLKRQQVKKRRRKHAVRNTLLSILGLVVLLGGIVGWMAHNALQARARLQEAVAIIPALERQVRDDPEAAGPQLAALQQVTGEARTRTTGPLWTIASHVPVVGPNIEAMGTITEVVDSLSHNVLPELSSAVESVQPSALAPSGGRINLAPILEVRDSVVTADNAVNMAITSLARIDRAPLVAQLSEAANDLEGRLRDVSTTTATAARAVQLIPPALGADGPRDWLILAQNNGQTRATGGIVGAVILVRTDNGAVQFVDKGSTGWFPYTTEPVLPITPEEVNLWGDRLGRWPQNVSLTPDFPRTAQLAAEMWRQVHGDPISGVLSMDPVVLQQLLAVTGPVTFPDPYGEIITLDGNNAAKFLMSEIYAKYENPDTQDEVFGEAAEAVFARMMGGDIDGHALIEALVVAADQGRLMVWSAVPGEQELLAPTVLSGQLRGIEPNQDGTRSPIATVAVNIDSSSKLGFYLDIEAEVIEAETLVDGSQLFTVQVALSNILAPGAGYALPSYVIGTAPADGTIEVHMYVYGPAFGSVLTVSTPDGAAVDAVLATHQGFDVAVFDLDIRPGTTQTFNVQMLSGFEQRGPVRLSVTPGPRG